jgi:tetratricopeptide (TPR) repeat protein
MAGLNIMVVRVPPVKLLTLAALSVGLGFSQGNDCDTLDKCQDALKMNRHSSLLHFRIGEIYFMQGNLQGSANEFRESLNGDFQPRWTEVWDHINLGKIFDTSGQRDRALNEYRQALKTKDNTRGALDEARKYIQTPYDKPNREAPLPPLCCRSIPK